MLKNTGKRRGMTLAEIMICIAVVSIAVVMVVSFSIMIGDRMERSQAQLEAREELEMIESLTRGWLNNILMQQVDADPKPVAFALSQGTGITDANIAVLVGQAPEAEQPDTRVTYTLTFQYGRLTGTRPDADPISVRAERITGMTFLTKANDAGDMLFYCKVQYQIPVSGSRVPETMSHIFCVNPHLGETLPPSA